MDFKWQEYDIEWLKTALAAVSIIMIVGAILMALLIVPIVKVAEQRGTLETYYYQAKQAATPIQFADALRQLDKALDKASMVSGNTEFLINGPDSDMAFKRQQFQSLSQRAEALAELPVSATEVSTGLADLRVALKNIDLGVYGFWLWQQGGAWFQLYVPVIGIIVAIAMFIVSDDLPYVYRRRVKVHISPT